MPCKSAHYRMIPHAASMRGNALFLILIAVALFAALSYAITQSSRGGGNIDKEQAKLDTAVAQLCSAHVAQAVERLKIIGGCTEGQISYELSDGTNANPDAPEDKHCHVFDPAGAGETPCGSYLIAVQTDCDLTALAVGEKCSDSDIVYVSDNLGSRLYTTLVDQAPGYGIWSDVDALCTALGDGWRLPTKDELNELYLARHTGALNGTFNEGVPVPYWSSTMFDETHAWYQHFFPGWDGYQDYINPLDSLNLVRCVKT